MTVSNRVFWAATFLAGCTILSAGLAAQESVRRFAGPVQAPAVRATRFEVVDNAGRVKAQIGVRPDGTVYTVGINTPAAPSAVAAGVVSPPAGQDALRNALSAQQQSNQTLRIQLEQERLRLEQERIRQEQNRLWNKQPGALP